MSSIRGTKTEAVSRAQDDLAAVARPAVTVDLVLIGLRDGRPSALLLKRTKPPHAGRWSLPGGFVGIAEALDTAAERILREQAGNPQVHLEQLYTFGAVKRDPRARIVTVAYLALLRESALADALNRGSGLRSASIEVPWAGESGGPVAAVAATGEPLPLAFDHADILALAMLRLRGKLDYSEVGFMLLPETFTLRQLQDVHEAILGIAFNKSAFRRRMLDRGWLEGTGRFEAGTSFRPAELFRFRKDRHSQGAS